MTARILLRAVQDSDLPIFFEHQRDPHSVSMAAFPAREQEAHIAHWMRIMDDHSNILRTILFDDRVAGNVVSWNGAEGREVGYWIGREFWGRGIATQALRLLLEEISARPLIAHAARHNLASRRVLEKCGFALTGVAAVLPNTESGPVAELAFRLD